MKRIAEKLRKIAETLRKHAADQKPGKPGIVNTVASRAAGDLGSMDKGIKSPSTKIPELEPKLPKLPGVGG